MTIWFTADLHLSHARIAELAGRPFTDVDSMNAAIVDAWNDRVTIDDTVWVLGDVALGKIADTLPLVGLLTGRKILVAGNHDRCWTGHRKVGDWPQRYLDAGFTAIEDIALVGILPSHVATVCHFPYAGDSNDTDRYAEHRPTNHGGWLLHGHSHGRWRQRGRMIDVGVDAWAGRPVSEHEIAALIDAGPNDLPALPWETP